MRKPNEKVLCCIRTSNSDLVLTSERVIRQSLPFSVTVQHFVARVLTGTLVPLEYIFGTSRYSAWEEGCNKVLGGAGTRPSTDPREVIEPQRITVSIPYGEITEARMERSTGDWVYGEISVGETSLPFALDDARFSPFWHFLSPILGDKIVYPGKEEMSNLKRVWLTDVCRYLNGLGFQAEIADIVAHEPEKGIISLKGRNVAVVAKDTPLGRCRLRFAVEGVQGKVDGATLKKQKKGEGVAAFEWKGKELAQVLSRDPTLREKLLSWRQTDYEYIRINISGVTRKGQIGIAELPQPHRLQNCVQIEDQFVERLPPGEYFGAIDTIAGYIRGM